MAVMILACFTKQGPHARFFFFNYHLQNDSPVGHNMKTANWLWISVIFM